MKLREIKNWQLRYKLDKAGLNKVRLYKDDGIFWIMSDDETCDNLRSSSIYCNNFSDMTISQWAEAIKDMFSEENVW